jgi:hypothetical protein
MKVVDLGIGTGVGVDVHMHKVECELKGGSRGDEVRIWTDVPLQFPDLLKEQEGCTFGIDGCVCGDEVCVLGYTVDDVHNCIIAMGFQQFDYEVDTDHVPWCLQCL